MAPSTTERPALPTNLRRTSLWTIILLGVTMLVFALGMPYSLAVLVTAPATAACAISALIYSRGVESTAFVRVWLWIAIGMSGMSFLVGLGLVIAREPYEQLEACLARAITPSAQRECELEYEKAMDDLLKRYSEFGVTTP
jgi:hypothetical protein